MAKETLGYVRLEWTCPNCSTRNPGPQKMCSSCGSPQPEDVKFEQPVQAELIKDEAEIARAKIGPDVHCAYCGTRNPADAKTCSQCGADLTQAAARVSGEVLGAFKTGPAEKIACPACGTPNDPNAPKCVQCGAALARPETVAPPPAALAAKGGTSKLGLIIGAVLLLLCLFGAIGFFVLAGRTEDMTGQVQAVNWVRRIAVMGLVPVNHEDWRDEIPAGAVVGSCTSKPRRLQDDPAPNAQKICGTPYTVDKGSGHGEVVQECQYQVYDDSCQYTVEELRQVDEVTLTGTDLNPRWPTSRLVAGQREGSRSESYKVTFRTEQGELTYETDDPAEFARFQPGSRWVLKVNAFNAVVSAEPAE